jgi:hypothetical protein
MKTIIVQPGPWETTFKSGSVGDVFRLCIHGCSYPPELRLEPPRIRIVSPLDREGFVECELLDDWPDAPPYWPPESAPNPTRNADQGRKAKTA